MIVKIRKISLFVLSFLLFVSFVEKSSAEQYGPVKSGDTLWPIASKTRPDSSVSLHQMLIALLKENPDAFRNPCNFNTLKSGKMLTIPPLAKIAAMSQTEAVAEFNRQNEQWRNRQQEMTCSALLEQSGQEETAKTSLATGEEKAPVEEPPLTGESSLQREGVTDSTPATVEPATDSSTKTPVETESNVVEPVEEVKAEGSEKPQAVAETGEPVALPTEEVASISADPVDDPTPPVESEPTAVSVTDVPSEVVDAPPEETSTTDEPMKITKSIEEKTGFSVITVAVAVFIALLILGLLAWLAFREKANNSSLRKKTERAVLSNQCDKMYDNDTDADLDLFADTFTKTAEQRRTQ